MPQMKKATAPPPPPKSSRNSGKVGAAKGFKSQQKKDPSLRRRPIEANIYGDEILKPIINKEREIVICFYPFTKNNYRISTEGKFIIERVETDEDFLKHEGFDDVEGVFKGYRWNLFYFPAGITDFTAPTDLNEFKNLEYNLDLALCVVFKGYISVKNLADKVIALVREEYFQAKQLKLEELREQERKYQEDLDKLEAEKELEEENAESESLRNIGKECNSENAGTETSENSTS